MEISTMSEPDQQLLPSSEPDAAPE
eukprot:COSAG04_NODE_29705_length_267_cov_0.619048_1_plen_24_part_10